MSSVLTTRAEEGAQAPKRISASEYRSLVGQSRPAKINGVRGAKGVWLNGEYFGSLIEAHHVNKSLRSLEKIGLVFDLQRQVHFPLHALNGKKIGDYVADATFYDEQEAFHVQDVKGDASRDTDLAKWKIKHAESEYGFAVEIIRLRVRKLRDGRRKVEAIPQKVKRKVKVKKEAGVRRETR